MWTRQFLWISGSAALLSSVSAQYFTGDLTTYTLGTPMSGNCNYMTAPTAAAQNYAALNGAQWDATKNCGRCAEVSCVDSRCPDQTKTEIVYILDQCPECKSGDLDISPSVSRRLTGADPGRYKIKWKFVDCPVQGNLKYCLKTGSNAYYAAIQPANSVSGIKSMTINSKATKMVPSAFYYLLESNINLQSVQVSVTSINGETITDTVALTAGQCTTGTSQFKGSGSGSTPSTPSSPSDTPSNAPSPATDAPVSPSTPTTRPTPSPRPTPTTKRPRVPSPTTRAPGGGSGASLPPRTEDTKPPATSSPSGSDSNDNDAPATVAPSPASPAANTTTAPATPATVAPTPTTTAPITPSTPQPSKNGSKCRRRLD